MDDVYYIFDHWEYDQPVYRKIKQRQTEKEDFSWMKPKELSEAEKKKIEREKEEKRKKNFMERLIKYANFVKDLREKKEREEVQNN